MASVEQWLSDLRWMTDCECMSVLQSKSLTIQESPSTPAGVEPYETTNGHFSISVKDHIERIRHRAEIIGSEFTKLFSKIEKDRWKHVSSRILRIASNLRSLMHDYYASMSSTAPQHILNLERQLVENCDNIHHLAAELSEINGILPKKGPLVEKLITTGEIFGCFVEAVLGYLIQTIIRPLTELTSLVSVKSSTIHLNELALDGEHMCFIITKEGGVSALLNLCNHVSLINCWSQALRTLATICCIPEGIHEVEKENGVELLTFILNNYSLCEAIRAEASGTVAQITSPSLEQYEHLSGFLENMDDLIRSLTVLCVESSNSEVFLLATAAVANITFMDSLSCDYLLQYHTARVLLEACQLNRANSIFTKDQVVTILTNMAAIESCCQEITDNNGIELLLHFLQECPYKYNIDKEKSSCERVQQKAAIALTRLSREPENAQIIIECQGLTRLVVLCRDSYERNNSDAVLVACLAALRKISSICGLQDFNSVDVQQLIKPKLLDSFLICSRLEESYV